MGKNSFILYDNWKPLIESISDEEAGILLKAVYCYRENGEILPVPVTLYPILQLFVRTLEIDEEKYRKKCATNRVNKIGKTTDND